MGTRFTPEDAYRFAKGQSLTLADGTSVKLDRPLDFVAITDHAETFGVMGACQGFAAQSAYCQEFARRSDGRSFDSFRDYFLPALWHNRSLCSQPDIDCSTAGHDVWQRVVTQAEAANEPGVFTAFVANEWSSSPANLHWHRNLIYRTSDVPVHPINAIDEPGIVSMWRALDDRCRVQDNCEVLAIPHNSNLGLGGSFAVPSARASDFELRSRFEKLIEIHQHKGQSECYPGALLSDEACDFEIRIPIPIAGQGSPPTADQQLQIANGYVRQALADGVRESATDQNTLKLGFVGATDTHSARPGDVEDSTWRGASGRYDLNEANRKTLVPNNPGGLTGVWAQANTRDAIFNALGQRATYATSGPRIAVRFFHSSSPDGNCETMAQTDATFMGGTLPGSDTEKAYFYVEVLKDRVPLARVDLIKLSLVNDQIKQTIQSIDLVAGQQTQACVQIDDSDFDASVPSVWYARVLQQPTPRWRRNDDGTPKMIAERAWTSPIWHEPAGQ